MPALLVAAWVVLATAWIWTNPLGAAPDEGDHYVRAVAAGNGNFVGTPAPNNAVDRAGVTGGRRYFPVPAGLAPPPQFACDAFQPDEPATCSNGPFPKSTTTVIETTAGTYSPIGYLVPGMLIRLATDPASALRLGRVGSALVSLSLLGVAVRLLWSRGRSSIALVGLVLAVTPMQIFLLTEVGPNGLEVAAAVCYAAALLRMTRPQPVSSWHWAGLAYAGVMLGATRPLGPAWLLGGLVVAMIMAPPSRILHRFREHLATAAAASLVIVAAAAANIAWQSQYVGTGNVSIRNGLRTYWDAVDGMPRLLQEMVGWFGWLDTRLPSPFYMLWMALVISVACLALLVGTRRQRVLIILLGLATVLVGGLVATYLSLALGYGGGVEGVQGRYLMPLVIWFPLVCGEVLYLGRARLGYREPRRVALYIAAIVAFVQFSAWLVNSRRYAVGASGSIFFIRFPLWEPPGGWWLWMGLALIAVALLTWSGLADSVTDQPNGESLAGAGGPNAGGRRC